jgi:hypothetical protein
VRQRALISGPQFPQKSVRFFSAHLVKLTIYEEHFTDFHLAEWPRPRAAACPDCFEGEPNSDAEAEDRTLTTMLLTPSEISSHHGMRSWFCLRAQPKREHIAVAACGKSPKWKSFVPGSASGNRQVADQSGSSNLCFRNTCLFDLTT